MEKVGWGMNNVDNENMKCHVKKLFVTHNIFISLSLFRETFVKPALEKEFCNDNLNYKKGGFYESSKALNSRTENHYSERVT